MRNKWVWDRANGSAFGVIAVATNLLRDWREAQILAVTACQETGARVWEKPATGWLKVNVDAAIFRDDNIRCDAVIRDAQGTFMGTMCKKIEGVWRPKEAEAIAMKEA